MNNQEILSSIQTQLVILMPCMGPNVNEHNAGIQETTTFYNDLISEMPSVDLIQSFVLGIDTNQGKGPYPHSNLLIITFAEDPEEKSPMYNYLTEKLNTGHDYIEFTWLSNKLIIDLEY